jgi:tetratricopeptide (TPR) repeat protein
VPNLKLNTDLKTKIKILLTESFFPYLFLIITLLIALVVIDRKMESQDDLVVVNLNREDLSLDDQPGILQRIDPANIPSLTDEKKKQTINEINALIDQRQWKTAVKNIENLADAGLKNDIETMLTLAFLYYKKGESQKGIEILNKITAQNNPRYYYNMGLLHSRHSSNYPNAIKYFEKYLEYKKSSYEAFMNIGHLHYRLAHNDEALKYFKKSEELSNMQRRAKALYWEAMTYVKMKNIDKALENLDQAIHYDPELVMARVHRAELLIQTDPENSLETLKRLALAYPEYLETYHVIADHYIESGELEKGLYWLKKGLDNAPNSTKTKSGIGVLYLKLKEYEKAKLVFLELSGQFPGDEIYYFNLARSHYGLGDYVQAIETYEKALAIRPDYYEVFINMGIVYAKLNNHEKALYYYNKAAGLNPNDASMYFNMGILYGKLDQKQAAINAYRKATAIQGDYPEAYFNMGIVYARMTDYENSVKSYLNAIYYKKDYINAYYNLAGLYENRGDMKKAMDILDSGIKITQDVKLKNRLAQNYETGKDNKKAQKIYMEILKQDSENTDALFNVSKLYLALRNYNESKKYIDMYLSENPKDTEARYILMVDVYNLGNFDQAWNQWQILDRISPDYKDIADYKDKIISKMD